MLQRKCKVGYHGFMLHFKQKISMKKYQVIDFKQASGSIARNKLWSHSRSCQVPDHILSI